jgi:hypothetical protein
MPERECGGVEQPTLGHRVPQIQRVREVRVDVVHLLAVEQDESSLNKCDFPWRGVG